MNRPNLSVPRERIVRSAVFMAAVLVIFMLAIMASAQSAHFGGVQTVVAGALNNPGGVAVDASGDIFIADTANHRILEETLSNGVYTQSVIIGSLNTPNRIAVDSTGNLYFTNASPASLQKLAYSNGAYASTPTTIPTSLQSPDGVAVDSGGNIFVADTRLKEILRFVNLNGDYVQSVAVPTGLNMPAGVALDSSGDLFIADPGLSQVLEATYANGAWATPTALLTGFSKPYDVAVDASGNLAVATGQALLYAINDAGSYTSVLLATNVNNPLGIAMDTAGNVVLADTSDQQVLRQVLPQHQSFGAVTISQTTAAQSLVFVFDTAGTLNASSPSLAVLGGKENLDYATVPGTSTTCTAAKSVAVNSTCLVAATFTPLYPGQRKGAVVLLGSSGTPAATAYLSGTGLSGEAAFAPVQTPLGQGIRSAAGVAVDGAGDVFIADSANGRVLEESYSNGVYTQAAPITGFLTPTDVAVDGAGNLFIADAAQGVIYKETLSLGSYVRIGNPIAEGPEYPTGVAVDGAGNLYVVNSDVGEVVKEVYTGSGYQQSNSVVISGLDHPVYVAVDGAGNVYADGRSSTVGVLKATPSATGYTVSQLTLNTPITSENGLAVDSAGDLFLADSTTGQVDEEVLNNGTYSLFNTFGNGLSVAGIAVDGAGNVYISDSTTNQVFAENVSTAPSLSFASTPIGVPSVDSPQSVALTNIGNAVLQFNGGLFSTDPDFVASIGNCGAALNPNQNCSVAFQYQPQSLGTHSGGLTFLDSSLAPFPTATQTVSLSGGAATATPQTISFNGPPSSSYVSGAVLPLTASSSSGLPVSFTVTFTGSVTAVVNGVVGAQTLTLGGSGTGGVLVTASQQGSSLYLQAAPITDTFNVTLVPSVASATLTQTAVGSSSNSTVNVVLTSAGTLSSAAGFYLGSAGLDYSATPASGSCQPGQAYPAGIVCSVNVTFAPSAPGIRAGAVKLLNGSGNILGTTLLNGTGTGPLLTFYTGASNQLVQLNSGGDTDLQAIVVDGVGDVFAAGYASGNLYEYPAGNSIAGPLLLARGLNQPSGIQMDGVRNLFVGDSFGVHEFLAAGNYTSAPILLAPNEYIGGLRVDDVGNLILGAYYGVVQYPAPGYSTLVQLYSETSKDLNNSNGVVVDPSGNIFLSASAGGIMEVPVSGPNAGTLVSIAGGDYNGLTAPNIIGLDAAGNLFLRLGAGDESLVEVFAATGYATSATRFGSGLGTALDSHGNVFFTTSQGALYEATLATAPTLAFPSTATGATSSPLKVTVSNIGNAPLTFPVPANGVNPQTGVNFALETNTDTTCPVTQANGTASTLASGAVCVLSYVFTPTQVGTANSTSVLTDNDLNRASATQPINLVGNATQGTQTAQNITFPQPAALAYPGSVTLSASASSGLAVTYTVTGPATLSGSTLTSTGPGTVTVTAAQTGNVSFAAAVPVTLTLTVSIAPTSINWQPSTLKIFTGATLSTILDASASVPSQITYTAALEPTGAAVPVTASTVLAQGAYALTATVTPTDTVHFATTSVTLLFTVQNMNVFVANFQGATVNSFFNNGTVQSQPTAGGGIGAAADGLGNVWSINADGNGVSRFTDSGTLSSSFSGIAGITAATALAIDGRGTVWVANGNNSVSSVTSAGAPANAALASAAGLNAPASLTIDAAGSLWIANSGNNTVTEIIGVAAPVTTPTAQSVVNNTLATQP